MGESRLDELAGASPDLRLVLDELRGSGLRAWAGRDPLLHAEVTAEHLSEFLSLLVREVPDEQLYGLAQVLPACVFRRGAGHEALEHVLTGGRLSAEQRELPGRSTPARSRTAPTSTSPTSSWRTDGRTGVSTRSGGRCSSTWST